jgi:quercetin dioxygenase-like cupin family protein
MKTLSIAGDRVNILVDGNDTAQAYAVFEATIPPGAGPPPHVHSREDETFLVLEGEITFHVGDKVVVLKKGEFLFAPRGIPHYFKNTAGTHTVLLETASPAGLEHYLEACGQVLPARNATPHPPTKEEVERMIKLAPEFGVTILAR